MAGTPSSSRSGGDDGGGLFDAYAYLRDEKASGTDGGDFDQAAWRTRTLNTLVFESEDIVTLAANQFTLAAGTYYVEARAPAWDVGRHKVKLRNATDAADTLIGNNAYADATNDVGNYSFLHGRFTIAAAKAFELQHHCQSTKAAMGLGVACNIAATVEIYAEVMIWRESA